MSALAFLPKTEFDRLLACAMAWEDRLSLVARMCRLNALFSIKHAGSGHPGSVLSALDIVTYLYFRRLNVKEAGLIHPGRDIYFSSKGHDVPAQYSVLYALGLIPEEKFLRLRRRGGLDGHPNVENPGMEANSGSLGMGISKARGMAFGKKQAGLGGRVLVMVGDGELQEGQNFEALQSAVQQGVHNLTVIVDHNKLQSERLVDQVVSLGNLEDKVRAFGWHVERANGHDFASLENAMDACERVNDRPRFLLCDTVKGKGISFMEHPLALEQNQGSYPWHAGAPGDEIYQRAFAELLAPIEEDWKKFGLGKPQLRSVEKGTISPALEREVVAAAWGQSLARLGETNEKLLVLDADLSQDCRLKEFETRFPNRFVECGIAEQDMVSMAAGLAHQGFLPVVHSFGSFLASRANEQIYNALSEGRKMVFACHYSGLLPAGPGKSHQSVRDISLFGALPNCEILQAANAEEMRQVADYALAKSRESCMVRINMGASPRNVALPAGYRLQKGKGAVLTRGEEYALLAYGPVMLHGALSAEELLRDTFPLKVVNMPWLNRFDTDWLETEFHHCKRLFVLEDHSVFGGLGDSLAPVLMEHSKLHKIRLHKFGLEEYPAFGTAEEVLEYHRLDGKSLARRILEKVRERA
ncbi:MAG TPA: transketolase C-terminal domain-containing protein [Bdellovibrionota bacterium]|jgi:transketolase